ncbi:hypothetical protein PSFL107428_23735 [Pseudoalteromonas maricaloris]
MAISFLAAFVSTLSLPFLDIVDNADLGNYTQSAVTHRSYHIAMFDNRADLFCMIEGADKHAIVGSSLYDFGGNY